MDTVPAMGSEFREHSPTLGNVEWKLCGSRMSFQKIRARISGYLVPKCNFGWTMDSLISVVVIMAF